MSPLPDEVDLAVVGAGISGNACALAAARQGGRVLVIDKEPGPAGEASGWAQGALRVQGRHPAETPLALEALAAWQAIAAETPDPEIVFGGNIYLCDDAAETAGLQQLVAQAHASGLPDVRLLSPDEARAVLPAARGPFLQAMWSAVDGHCHPAKATGYFAERAATAGATHAYGTTALEVTTSAGRVSGVRTSSGTVRAGRVVVAAGVWAPHLLRTVGVRVPIMPVVLSEAETTPLAPLFEQSIRSYRFGGHQRPDGRIVFSAGLNSVVRHGVSLADLHDLRIWLPRLRAHRRDVRMRFDHRATWRQLRHGSPMSTRTLPLAAARPPRPDVTLMDSAFAAMQAVLPDLGTAQIERYWAGMIDMTPDGLPVIDAQAGPGGLVIATGFSGHGLALGPAIGRVLADLALHGRSEHDLDAFRLARLRDKVPMPLKMI